MRILLVGLCLSVALMMAAGCGKSAPKCDDEVVQKLVKDTSFESFRDRLLQKVIVDQVGMAPQMSLTYAEYTMLKDKDPEIPKLLKIVDEKIKTMTLTGIRTTEEEKNIRKCTCKGNLEISNGDGIEVTYTAQYTDDGSEVHVEVFGLD